MAPTGRATNATATVATAATVPAVVDSRGKNSGPKIRVATLV
jgi:hypothetical protein